MRYASILFPVLSASLLVVACAESDSAPIESSTQPTEPTTNITAPPAAATPTPPPAKQCAPSCKTDSDCQNSCPAVTNGVQCCDTTAGKCFASSTSTCPAPQQDPQQPAPAY